MSIVQIVMDERESRIRIRRRQVGERNYRLADKRISAIISALLEIGERTPLTNWIFAPNIPESQRGSLISEHNTSEATLIPVREYAWEELPHK